MLRKTHLMLALLALCALMARARAGDWPQYKGNAARTGVAGEGLETPLECQWVYQPTQKPRPAWEEPGKEEPDSLVEVLRSLRQGVRASAEK